MADNGQTATYTYPVPGANAVRPNAVTSITRPSGTDNYTFNSNGQLVARTVNGKQSTFDWNELGQLVTATIDGKQTSMIYDADGERLIRRDPDGTSTLYLVGTELELSGEQVAGKRYYNSADGAQIAMRDAGGVTWLLSGSHGSTQLAINNTTGTVNRERYLPFGQRRGGDDLPFTDRGFLGKIEDTATGLNYLGARYYDPTIAKFISTDPLLDPRKPEWANPYSYAGNNPIGMSDPTGLSPDHCGDGSRRMVCPSPPSFIKDNNPQIVTPSRRLTAEEIEEGGATIFGVALQHVAEYLQKLKGPQRSRFTIVLAEVVVETKHGPVPRIIAFTSQGGIPDALKAQLSKLGVTVYKAPKSPSKDKNGHAERAAADLRNDVKAQVKDLGGRITTVKSAFSTIQICTKVCEDRLNRFIGDPTKSVRAGTNGMIGGKVIDSKFLNAARGLFGIKGSGVVASLVASKAYIAGMFRGGRGGPGSRSVGR